MSFAKSMIHGLSSCLAANKPATSTPPRISISFFSL